jgi:uncharacterized membrane protein YkvI
MAVEIRTKTFSTKFTMKKLNLAQVFLFVLMLLTFTGCDVILDIFEAGMWVGVIIVILIIFVVIWLVRKFMR